MDARSQEALAEFAGLVRQRFPSARIWAFGSRARGTNTEASDLDVCVVVDTLDDAVDQAIGDLAWQVGFERGLVISTVPYSRDEFQNGPCAASPLVRTVLHEGIPA